MSLLLLLDGPAGAPPVVADTTLTSVLVHMGLGGSFRSAIMDTLESTFACWPLKDLGGPFHNIARNAIHAFSSGPEVTRGVQMDVPEGALGVTLGTGYVYVPHTSSVIGYTPGGQAMTLSGTGCTLWAMFALVRTTTNDATLRCVMGKQNTGSGGNGYHTGLQNGKIRLFWRVGGVTILNFDSGSTTVTDGLDHSVLCFFLSSGGATSAYIYIDGALAAFSGGAAATMAATTADFRIGQFADGSGQFPDTISYALIGGGDEASDVVPVSYATAVEASRTWTAITPVLSAGDLTLDYGINDTGPQGLVASTGVASITLRNLTPGGLAGYYTPGHANCRSGFDIGTPVCVRTLDSNGIYKDWRGRIRSIAPEPGSHRGNRVSVMAVDWFDIAANTPMTDVPTQVGKTLARLVGRVVDEADIPPPAVSLNSTAVDTFGYALDSNQAERQPALTELQRLSLSGLSKAYITRSEGSAAMFAGGVFVEEDFDNWSVRTPAASFDNTMQGLEITYDRDALINTARVTYTLRVLGSSMVLYTNAEPVAIAAGATITLTGKYTDVNQPGLRVGAVSFTTPVAGTDYAGFENANSSGTNITASLNVTVDTGDLPGGGAVTFVIRNDSGIAGYVTLRQIRGIPIYFYDPETVVTKDTGSIHRYGKRVYDWTAPYGGSLRAQQTADWIIASRSTRLPMATSMSFVAKAGTLLEQALTRDVGDVIELRESVSTGSVYVPYYIQRVRLDFMSGFIVRCQWMLSPQG